MWCTVLLIDALISLLNMTSQPHSSMRRAFNQELVLFECIVAEVASKESSGGLTDTISSLDFPWTSMSDLRDSLSEGPHSKAKAKYAATVDMLVSHEVFAQFNSLQEVIQALFVRVSMKNALAPDVMDMDHNSSPKRMRVLDFSPSPPPLSYPPPSFDHSKGVALFPIPVASVGTGDVVLSSRGDVTLKHNYLFLGSDCSLDGFIFDEHIFGDAFMKHFVVTPSSCCTNNTSIVFASIPVQNESTAGFTSGDSESESELDGLDFDSFFNDELSLF